MRAVRCSLVVVLLLVAFGSAEGQYLAPRAYVRQRPGMQPAPAPSPSGLPPGPLVVPAPVLPAPAVTAGTPKAVAQKEAATQRTVEFQKKRALAGSASAQYTLGLRYLEGDGVPRDLAEAVKWLQAAARQDHTWAQRRLAALEKEYGTLPLPADERPGAEDRVPDAPRPEDGSGPAP